MARYGFQVHASILKMLDLHQTGNDYRAVFDHFDEFRPRQSWPSSKPGGSMRSLSSCERNSFAGAIVHRRAHASRRRPYCVGLLKLLVEVHVATSQAVGGLVNAKGE